MSRPTDEDLDALAGALIPRLNALSDKALEPVEVPERRSCQAAACVRTEVWLAKIIAEHPDHGTPEPFEVHLCDVHGRYWRYGRRLIRSLELVRL